MSSFDIATLVNLVELLERQAFPTGEVCIYIKNLIERLEPSKQSNMVDWIKWYRAKTGCDLKEAVDELKRLKSLKH